MRKEPTTKTAEPHRKRLKIEWNKITWYSKLVAVIVFVATFFVGMWIGMQYQYTFDQYAEFSGHIPNPAVAR